MPEYKLDNASIRDLIIDKKVEFPKYASPIINLASRYAQATRPSIVGQMSELIKRFDGNSYSEWEKWYREHYPNSIDQATSSVMSMIKRFERILEELDESLVRSWVEDLILVKTFTGLRFQEAIFKYLSNIRGVEYRLATPEEESRGIDGYLDGVAYSIKPHSYRSMELNENIAAQIIYYEKDNNGITFSTD